MLCTYEQVFLMPGMNNLSAAPTAWVNALVGAASTGVKRYLKRDIELTAYDEPFDGHAQRDITLRQFPVWMGQTVVAGASDAAILPQATINVASTTGFHPGTGGNTNVQPPAAAVQTGVSTWTWFTYTGTTATSFTGCSGGTGTIKASYGRGSVSAPVVFFD